MSHPNPTVRLVLGPRLTSFCGLLMIGISMGISVAMIFSVPASANTMGDSTVIQTPIKSATDTLVKISPRVRDWVHAFHVVTPQMLATLTAKEQQDMMRLVRDPDAKLAVRVRGLSFLAAQYSPEVESLWQKMGQSKHKVLRVQAAWSQVLIRRGINRVSFIDRLLLKADTDIREVGIQMLMRKPNDAALARAKVLLQNERDPRLVTLLQRKIGENSLP